MTIVTIFYSNYSGNSKALLQYIKNAKLMDKLSIKFINIDNTVMRDVVMRKFTVVPSIVVMIGDEISLYTGDNAFEWFYMFNSNVNSPVEDNLETNNTKSTLELAAELFKARESIK